MIPKPEQLPGIVSGRVALLLRSIEIQPAAAPICPKMKMCMLGDAQHVEETDKIGLDCMNVDGLTPKLKLLR